MPVTTMRWARAIMSWGFMGLDFMQVAAAIGVESGDTLLAAIPKTLCLAVGQQRHLPNGNAVELF